MRNKVYSLIMAGGSGTRFWPRSRDKKPKQFLTVFGNETLIQNTINRYLPLSPMENIYIISKQAQSEELLKHNLTVSYENIIYEPVGKNTLPCIGLACLFIQRRDPEGVVVVTPSDHLVDDLPLFRETIQTACKMAADNDTIVTIGIDPSVAATGYGYIRKANEVLSGTSIKAFKVKNFVEKPDIETAEKYYKSGEYLWNSGIFVFKCSVIWNAIKEFAPDVYSSLKEIDKFIGTPFYNEQLANLYGAVRGISIDYGIMEKADNIYVVKGNFMWNDLGSWEQVYSLTEKDENKNAVVGKVILKDTENSYIYSQNGLIALVGVKDLLVVQDGNATLVMDRKRSEEIKQVVELIRNKGLNEYI